MGRWRPPPEKSSPYITPEGARRLRAELADLWHQQRPEVVRAITAAAAEGDRSENAEYIYRKKQLREMDRRIQYLSRRVEQFKVVDETPRDTQTVRFGAWVEVRDDEDQASLWRIVGADEITTDGRCISVDSPVARALIGKSVGEDVEVERPAGPISLYIESVSYQAPDGWTG